MREGKGSKPPKGLNKTLFDTSAWSYSHNKKKKESPAEANATSLPQNNAITLRWAGVQ